MGGGAPNRHGGYFYLKQDLSQVLSQFIRFGLPKYFTVAQNGRMNKSLLMFIVFISQCSVFAAIPNLQTISDQISRGGRPERIDLEQLKNQGFKTVINLDNDSKVEATEKANVEKLGMKFYSFPMNAWQTPEDQKVNTILSLMSDQKNYPIFIHCHHGRDRTGMMSAIYRVLEQKWTQEAAHEEMMALGFRQIFTKMDQYFWNKTK